MTYKDIITLFEKAAKEEPTVNSFYYDSIEALENQSDIAYAAVVLTPIEGQRVDERIDSFGFTLTYVDRFNETTCRWDIHAAAFATLKDIINRMRSYNTLLDEDGGVFTVEHTAINFYPGALEFNDTITGAWVELEVQADNSVGECCFDTDC